MPERPYGDLSHHRLTQAALSRAGHPVDRCPAAEADIRSEPWWRVRTLRRTTARKAVSVCGLVALVFVTVSAMPWWADAAALAQGPTAMAKATVREVDEVFVPLLPDNLGIEFRTADGRRVRTSVALQGEPPAPGETLTIEYALDSPAHAAAAGRQGLLWGVADSLVLAALCLARVVWCAVAAARTTRALVTAARSPEAHPVRYVQLRDCDDGQAWLLFFPVPGGPADLPGHLLPVRGGVLPPAGIADLRGDPVQGGAAVPWIDGRAVWPSGELVVFGPEDEPFVLRLATGISDSGDPGGRRQPLA